MAGKTAEGTYVKAFLAVSFNVFGLIKAIIEYLVKNVIMPAINIHVQII